MALGGSPPPSPLLPADPPQVGDLEDPQELLQVLGGLLGEEGLGPPLRKELQQAESSLSRSRELWLRWETLWRILGEILMDPRDLEPSVVQELQEGLTWAQLRRGNPQIAPLVPPPKPLPPPVVSELGRRLKEQRDELGALLLPPPCTNPPETPPNPPQTTPNPAGIPQNPPDSPQKPPEGLLEAELGRLRREKRRKKELETELRSCRDTYQQTLQSLHQHLLHLRTLRGAQGPLDLARGSYLEAKAQLLLLRSRLEELQVLLDTYPSPTLEAHRRIRSLLSSSMEWAESEAGAVGAELSARKRAGPELLPLAQELGRLRQGAERARHALSKLRPPGPPAPS